MELVPLNKLMQYFNIEGFPVQKLISIASLISIYLLLTSPPTAIAPPYQLSTQIAH